MLTVKAYAPNNKLESIINYYMYVI